MNSDEILRRLKDYYPKLQILKDISYNTNSIKKYNENKFKDYNSNYNDEINNFTVQLRGSYRKIRFYKLDYNLNGYNEKTQVHYCTINAIGVIIANTGVNINKMPEWLYPGKTNDLFNQLKLALNSFSFLDDIISQVKKEEILSSLYNGNGKKISPVIYLLFMLLTSFRNHLHYIKISNLNKESYNMRIFLNYIYKNPDNIICAIVDYKGTPYFGIYNNSDINPEY